MIEDNNELRQQMEQLDAELESTRGELETRKANSAGPPADARRAASRRLAPVPPPQSAMEQTQAHSMVADNAEPNVQAAKVLGLAQEMADRLTAEAKTESDGMLAEARTKSEQLLSDARAKSDSMVNEARTRADTMLNDARTRAETLERQARDKATTMERESQRKYTETMNSLNSEKSRLNKRSKSCAPSSGSTARGCVVSSSPSCASSTTAARPHRLRPSVELRAVVRFVERRPGLLVRPAGRSGLRPHDRVNRRPPASHREGRGRFGMSSVL